MWVSVLGLFLPSFRAYIDGRRVSTDDIMAGRSGSMPTPTPTARQYPSQSAGLIRTSTRTSHLGRQGGGGFGHRPIHVHPHGI